MPKREIMAEAGKEIWRKTDFLKPFKDLSLRLSGAYHVSDDIYSQHASLLRLEEGASLNKQIEFLNHIDYDPNKAEEILTNFAKTHPSNKFSYGDTPINLGVDIGLNELLRLKPESRASGRGATIAVLAQRAARFESLLSPDGIPDVYAVAQGQTRRALKIVEEAAFLAYDWNPSWGSLTVDNALNQAKSILTKRKLVKGGLVVAYALAACSGGGGIIPTAVESPMVSPPAMTETAPASTILREQVMDLSLAGDFSTASPDVSNPASADELLGAVQALFKESFPNADASKASVSYVHVADAKTGQSWEIAITSPYATIKNSDQELALIAFRPDGGPVETAHIIFTPNDVINGITTTTYRIVTVEGNKIIPGNIVFGFAESMDGNTLVYVANPDDQTKFIVLHVGIPFKEMTFPQMLGLFQSAQASNNQFDIFPVSTAVPTPIVSSTETVVPTTTPLPSDTPTPIETATVTPIPFESGPSLEFSPLFPAEWSREWNGQVSGMDIPIIIGLSSGVVHDKIHTPPDSITGVWMTQEGANAVADAFLRAAHYRYTKIMGNTVTYEQYLDLLKQPTGGEVLLLITDNTGVRREAWINPREGFSMLMTDKIDSKYGVKWSPSSYSFYGVDGQGRLLYSSDYFLQYSLVKESLTLGVPTQDYTFFSQYLGGVTTIGFVPDACMTKGNAWNMCGTLEFPPEGNDWWQILTNKENEMLANGKLNLFWGLEKP